MNVSFIPYRSAAAVFALVCAFALLAAPAHADSRIRSGSCDVYATKVLDPIAQSAHLHNFYMGTVLSNADTGFDLKARGQTTCDSPNSFWATSGGWSPDGRYANLEQQTVYYRDPADIRVNPIPTDLRMLSHEVVFKGDLTTVHFPNCVAKNADGSVKLDSFDHKSHLYDATIASSITLAATVAVKGP